MPLFDKQEIKMALHRSSPLIFDNFGFVFTTERNMPSWADYENAQAERYPRSRLRRLLLWAQPKKRLRMGWQIRRLWDQVQAELANSMLDAAIELTEQGTAYLD